MKVICKSKQRKWKGQLDTGMSCPLPLARFGSLDLTRLLCFTARNGITLSGFSFWCNKWRCYRIAYTDVCAQPNVCYMYVCFALVLSCPPACVQSQRTNIFNISVVIYFLGHHYILKCLISSNTTTNRNCRILIQSVSHSSLYFEGLWNTITTVHYTSWYYSLYVRALCIVRFDLYL